MTITTHSSELTGVLSQMLENYKASRESPARLEPLRLDRHWTKFTLTGDHDSLMPGSCIVMFNGEQRSFYRSRIFCHELFLWLREMEQVGKRPTTLAGVIVRGQIDREYKPRQGYEFSLP